MRSNTTGALFGWTASLDVQNCKNVSLSTPCLTLLTYFFSVQQTVSHIGLICGCKEAVFPKDSRRGSD